METVKPAILYVDDEKDNLVVFKSSFRREFEIFTAESGDEAIEILDKETIKVVISDQRMPKMSGLELLKITAKKYPQAIRIILTAYSDISVVMGAINEGNIYRFLTKPWNKEDLLLTINNAVQVYDLQLENKKLLEGLQKANNELEVYAQTLEAKIQERTKNLLDEVTAKNKFSGMITHDIKNAFSFIIGIADYMKTKFVTMDDEKKIKIINEIFVTAKNTYDLLNNLLEWSRAQSNEISFSPEKQELSILVNTNIDFLRAGAEQKGVTIHSNIPDNVIVNVDRDMINLVFRNLIFNAIKYSVKGGFISVNYKESGSNIEVSVKDEGIGIDPEITKHLFDMGNIASTTGTSGEKGTGLGLILCKEFIAKHDGEIWVESAVSKGSTFFFTVPKG